MPYTDTDHVRALGRIAADQPTAYQSLAQLIKDASRDAESLDALDRRIRHHFELGTITGSEFARLDSMIFDRLVRLRPNG